MQADANVGAGCIVRDMNARLFLLPVLVAAGLAASFACGPASNEPPPETAKGSRPADKTEVTMEKNAAYDPDAGAPSSPVVSAPTATPAHADPTEDPMIGGPQDALTEKAVAPIRPRLRACWKKAITAEPGVGGSATFDATIGKDGKVASARFVKRDGLSEDMMGCLLVAVKAMTFEGARKSQIVAFTFGTSSAPAAASAPADAGAPKK